MKFYMFLIYVAHFMCYFVLTLSSYPGLSAILNSNGLHYLGTIAKKYIETQLPGKQIDDISGEEDSPVGKITYTAYDMSVVSFNLNAPKFNVNHGQLMITFQNINVFIKGTFKYRSWFARDHVNFDAYAKSGTVSLILMSSLTRDGHLQVKSISCSATLGSFGIKFHGGASWLYNFLIKYVIRDIKIRIENLICEEITRNVNKNLNNQLMEINTFIKVELHDYPNQSFWWNLTLIEPPFLTNQKISLKSDGHFFTNASVTHISSNDNRPSKTHFVPTLKMIDFSLSAFTVNSLLDLFFRYDIYTSYKFSKSDVSPYHSHLFNTTCESPLCIGSFIPQLAKYYPNSWIKTNISLVEAVKVEFKRDQAHLNSLSNLDFYVTDGNTRFKDQFIFSLFTSSNYSLYFDVINDVLKAKVLNVTFSNHVHDSKIGPLSDELLNYFFNANANIIIKLMNKFFYKIGLPLPDSKSITFISPILYLFENILQLSSDILYIQ